jgi:hypothetical protein
VCIPSVLRLRAHSPTASRYGELAALETDGCLRTTERPLFPFQANFHFILQPGANALHASLHDADAPVDWDAVAAVRLPLALRPADAITTEGGACSNSSSSGGVAQQREQARDEEEAAGWRCAICLERPRCPLMTRCGHGPFCAVCILRVRAVSITHKRPQHCCVCGLPVLRARSFAMRV